MIKYDAIVMKVFLTAGIVAIIALVVCLISTWIGNKVDIDITKKVEKILNNTLIVGFVSVILSLIVCITCVVVSSNIFRKFNRAIDNNELNKTILETIEINTVSTNQQLYIVEDSGEVVKLNAKADKVFISDSNKSYLEKARFDDGKRYIDKTFLYLSQADFMKWVEKDVVK